MVTASYMLRGNISTSYLFLSWPVAALASLPWTKCQKKPWPSVLMLVLTLVGRGISWPSAGTRLAVDIFSAYGWSCYTSQRAAFQALHGLHSVWRRGAFISGDCIAMERPSYKI
jgi:hypothetical protein